jgi:hypothetical protein
VAAADLLVPTTAETKGFHAVYTLPFVAHFLVATDHVKRGAATWELALKHPFAANSAWFAGVVGK